MANIRQGVLSKERAARKKMLAHTFATATPEQAEAWVENNVTDLVSAKQALKLLATAVIYLRDYVRITKED